MVLENNFRVLDAFSNMVIYQKLPVNCQENHRKLENVLTGGDVIQKYVQSPGWTFKSGNISKKAEKS